MRVFVTGASGHIASAVIPELLSHGHQVAGLARSDASAATVRALGAEVVRGDLHDRDGLRAAAGAADGVIHLAFDHEGMRSGAFTDAVATDLAVTETLIDALAGSEKPLVTTSGTLMLTMIGVSGRPGTEADAGEAGPRVEAENAVVAAADRGVRASVVRLPPIVHSQLDHHGFVSVLVGRARETGVSAYVGDGANRWPSVHTRDAARVYRLALEDGPAGSRWHAVADGGVPFAEIAGAIGRGLDVRTTSVGAEDAEEQFAFLGAFVWLDNPTASTVTRETLGWEPEQPGLIADLDAGFYFA